MSSFRDRLENERVELVEKYNKLNEFIRTSDYNELGLRQQHLLIVQASSMATYLHCLNERLECLK